MKTLNQQEISIVSGGASTESSYNYTVTSGVVLGAIVGTGLATTVFNPLCVAAGYGAYTSLGLSAVFGGLPGANLLSTAASALWVQDHK